MHCVMLLHTHETALSIPCTSSNFRPLNYRALINFTHGLCSSVHIVQASLVMRAWLAISKFRTPNPPAHVGVQIELHQLDNISCLRLLRPPKENICISGQPLQLVISTLNIASKKLGELE